MKSLLVHMSSLFSDENWSPEGASHLDLTRLEGTTCYCDADAEKAIEVYLDEVGVSKGSIDLTPMRRSIRVQNSVRFKNIEMIKGDRWEVDQFGKACFNVRIVAENDIKRVKCCFRILSADNSPITVLQTSGCLDCVKGREYDLFIEADFSQMLPGRYYMDLGLYEIKTDATARFFDRIDQAATFDILRDDNIEGNDTWDQRWQGIVKSEDMRILNIKQDNS
jgi:hypothetical protein